MEPSALEAQPVQLGEASFVERPYNIPLDGLGITAHPTRHSTPSDALCIERARDVTLRLLNSQLFQFVAIVHLILIVGVGAFFFFLLIGAQRMCYPQPCEPRNVCTTSALTSLWMRTLMRAVVALSGGTTGLFRCVGPTLFSAREPDPGRRRWQLWGREHDT